ncbi:hypothetical protein HYV91_02410 [Candidatus Wolfebacteria bacterium]|nr:hypothetical protein [Candidatus Wolfebacteria bacterium]
MDTLVRKIDIRIGDDLLVRPDEKLGYHQKENSPMIEIHVVSAQEVDGQSVLLVRRGLRRYRVSAEEIEKIFLGRRERRLYS